MRRALLLGVLGAPVALAASVAVWIASPLPAGITTPASASSITLTDRDGLPLRATRAADGSRSRWIPIGEMDPHLITAFVAAEDRRFYEHGAVDWRAVARAVRDNLSARRVVTGASTITMQAARLMQPTPRTWAGKFSQTMWAMRIGAHLDRQQILEQYLNRIPLGQGAVGVEAAAQLYYAASARSLSVGQAATLAGIARIPSRENPLVSPSVAMVRRHGVLARMRAAGFVDASAVTRAEQEPVLARSRPGEPFSAPHFTTRVLQWAEQSGASVPSTGALQTSLDLPLQTELEAEVRRVVTDLDDRGVHEAALVVLDNATGGILAWVGSPDFWDARGQTDMVVSARQPGSALKPFLYGLAFDRGYTPATVIADVARTYQTSIGPYHPRNYDRRFHGPVRAREALASSYNIPAVELAQSLSPGALLSTLHLAGFASLDRSAEYYGLGLALGNGDVTLLELANGYRAIASGGVWRPVTWHAGTERAHADSGSQRRVMSERASALVLDILRDPVARIPGFGLDSPLEFPFPVAAKTGTSRHFTDNWAVAATGTFTVAVWVGNFTGRPMDGVSGITGAGPLLHRAVLHVAQRHPPGDLITPVSAGAVSVEICRVSGLRAGPNCPHQNEWFMPGTEPARACDWHTERGLALPVAYASWESGGLRDEENEAPLAARMRTTSLTRASRDSARFRIVSPRDGDVYEVPPGVDVRYSTIAMRAAGPHASAVQWFVDGRVAGDGRFHLSAGFHDIRARTAAGDTDVVRVRVTSH